MSKKVMGLLVMHNAWLGCSCIIVIVWYRTCIRILAIIPNGFGTWYNFRNHGAPYCDSSLSEI